MTDKIIIGSNIKTFAVESENGDLLAEIKLDADNDAMYGRFVELFDNAMKIAETCSDEINALVGNDESIDVATTKQALDVNYQAIDGFIKETDAMFGAGFTRQIFRDHYEADAEFKPNITLFLEFYKGVMPLFEKVYKESRVNYTVTKGKRNE